MASSPPGKPPVTVDGRLKLVTLGSTRLLGYRPEFGQEPVEILAAGKGLALITYLHCLPNREASRDELIDKFWNNSGPRPAQGALRQLLYRLRGDLGQDPVASRGQDSAVALVLDLTSDRDLFLTAIQEGRDADAVDLYMGAFFPGYAAPGAAGFEQWADLERERLKLAFLRSATAAVRQALDRPETKEAVRLADRARDCCAESQAAWCLLLEALLTAGNRSRALLEADQLLTRLAGGGENIEPATERLIAKIHQSEAVVPLRSPDSPRDLLVTELVGREREFALLLDAWQRCQDTRAMHVHLTAPAGLGKTRLLHELANRLRPSRGVIAMVSAIPGEREVDHAFLSDTVEALTLPGWRAIAPGTLAELSALAPSLSAHRRDHGGGRSGIGSTATLIQAITELVSCVAGETPLAILLDDLHWADDQSLQIINGLLNRLKSERVLIVTTARPVARTLPASAATQVVELTPLSTDALLGMLSSLGADVGAYEVTALAEMLHHKSKGSPLLVLELLHLAMQQGRLRIDETGWTWTNPAAALRDIGDDDPLRLRIEGLPARARNLLLLISAAQAPLPLDVLSSVDADARYVLHQLEKDGLIVRAGPLLQATHDEIAATVLRTISADENRDAHTILGEWLATRLENDRTAFQRAAAHFREAQQRDRLVALFRAQVETVRRHGSTVPLRDLARSALGPSATPREQSELIRSLGGARRMTYSSSSRRALVAGLVLLLVAAVSWFMLTRPEVPPTAVLLLAEGTPAPGDRVRIYGFPIREDRWSGPDTISLREGRVLGRLPPGRKPYYTMALHPEGALAYDEITADSGGIDLMLLERSGRVRRLTATPGDDISPDWSPDGKFLVFATARWTPRGDEDSDLGVLDLETGVIRQLTRGPDYDTGPAWSPDGTHIAFDRIETMTGVVRPCIVTFDGLVERCAPSTLDERWRHHGWRNPDQVMLSSMSTDVQSPMATWHIPGNSLALGRPLPVILEKASSGSTLASSVAISSPDRVRLVIDRERPGDRSLVTPSAAGTVTGWFVPAERRQYIHDVTIEPRGISAVVGVSHRLRASGRDVLGRSVALTSTALRWATHDSTIATIDSSTGELFPREEGTVRIDVSLGGWRQASTEITITSNRVEHVFGEAWEESLASRWASYGDPRPSIVAAPDGTPALLNGGDQTFSSGIVSIGAVSAPAFGFEALVSTPIERPKWQRLLLEMGVYPDTNHSGAIGAAACGFLTPIGEGVAQMQRYSLHVGSRRLIAAGAEHLVSGTWYRIRLQIFPDATCGVAVDGMPMIRDYTGMSPESDWRIVISGQTVATQMLVGPLNAWTGVKTDMDWNSTYSSVPTFSSVPTLR